MLIISILIDIVLNLVFIVKFLFFCHDKFIFMKRANEIGTASNSATPEGNQIEGSFVICLNIWKADHHRKILFSLEEKEIGRAQNKKSKEYFSVVWRARCAVAGLASLVGVLLKKSSNINQKTPPIFTKSVNWRDTRVKYPSYTGIVRVFLQFSQGHFKASGSGSDSQNKTNWTVLRGIETFHFANICGIGRYHKTPLFSRSMREFAHYLSESVKYSPNAKVAE